MNMLPERLVVPPGMATAEYFMLSGTSMSAAVVSGAVALMPEKDSTLDNDTIKARLMRSASTADLGTPFDSGAGVLDVVAALNETGYATDAASPKAYRDEATGMIGFDNTGVLWGNLEWSQAVMWTDAVMWDDAVLWSDAILWSDAVLWSETGTGVGPGLVNDEGIEATAALWED